MRIAGFVFLGSVLATAAYLGAPVVLLVFLGAIPLATLLIPGGAGAAAARNLAGRLYDRRAWEGGWDRDYLSDRTAGGRPGPRSPRQEEPLDPGLLPEELPESKAWLRTLEAIRGLPERPGTTR